MSNREQRTYRGVNLRAVGDGTTEPMMLQGYAAIFGSYSHDLGGFREKIKPGAFQRAISEKQDVRFLMNHDPNVVLGRTKSGTLVLREDDKGLFFRVNLPDTQAARDLHTSIGRGDMDQCSFSFKVVDGGQTWGEDKDSSGYFATREVSNVDLFDVSAVTYPAYEDTSVSARELIPAEVRSSVEAKNKSRIVVPTVTREFDLEKYRETHLSLEEQIELRDYLRSILEF